MDLIKARMAGSSRGLKSLALERESMLLSNAHGPAKNPIRYEK